MCHPQTFDLPEELTVQCALVRSLFARSSLYDPRTTLRQKPGSLHIAYVEGTLVLVPHIIRSHASRRILEHGSRPTHGKKVCFEGTNICTYPIHSQLGFNLSPFLAEQLSTSKYDPPRELFTAVTYGKVKLLCATLFSVVLLELPHTG